MTQDGAPSGKGGEQRKGSGSGSGRSGGATRSGSHPAGGGVFTQYKPDQGKWTRLGTFVGMAMLIAWGAKFLYDRLAVYEGDAWWQLLTTTGIPIAFLALFGFAAWWLSYANRKASDFMIATEGEMKKVSWSTKREIIGSTKVVVLFTVLMAVTLFLVDVLFQFFFSSIGVLKT